MLIKCKMRGKSFSLVFGSLFLFLMVVGFVSAGAGDSITGNWNQTSLFVKNDGTTQNVKISISIGLAEFESTNGQAYCIDIIESSGAAFNSSCDISGTATSQNFERTWTVPATAINKVLSFRFKVAAISIDKLSANSLTLTGCNHDGACLNGENHTNCAYDCLPTFDSATASWWDEGLFTEYTNEPTEHLTFDSSAFPASSLSGNVKITGIRNGDGRQVRVDIYNGVNSIWQNTTTVRTGGEIIANWVISKSDISSVTNYTLFTPRATLYLDYATSEYTNETLEIRGDFSQWMNVSIKPQDLVVCDLSGATMTWSPNSLTFNEGLTASSTATISGMIGCTGLSTSFQIYEKDAVGGDDPIETLTGTNVNNGGASVSFTVDSTKVNAGKDAEDYPLEFIVKTLQVGSATKSFSDELAVTMIPIGSTCGNYITEEGEECDDGNYVNGDGCDLNCQNESSVCNINGATMTWSPDSLTFAEGFSASSTATISGIVGCDNLPASFNIYEKDAIGGDDPIETITGTVSSGSTGITFIVNKEKMDLGRDFLEGDPLKFIIKALTINGITTSFSDELLVTMTPAAVCGNGAKEDGEGCDDGNLVNNDGCSSICQVETPNPICNNTIIESGETCDDGNLIGGDGCNATCQLEVCGNSILDTGEACDDGNIANGDGCSSICQTEIEMDITTASGEWRNSVGTLWIDNYTLVNGNVTTFKIHISGITNPVEGATLSINIKEKDIVFDDNITTITATIQSDGTAVGTFTTSYQTFLDAATDDADKNYEFYFIIGYDTQSKSFKNDDILEVFVEDTVTCELFRTDGKVCSDYEDSGQCTQDICSVANRSQVVETINCSTPGVECTCVWAEGVCGPSVNTLGVGSCNFLEDKSGDNCNDGFLSYTWNATMFWDVTNVGHATNPGTGDHVLWSDGKWYYDPTNSSSNCKIGQNTIACPAQVQLSGFTWVNLVIALVIVAIIYYIFVIDKKKKAKHKTSDSKKKRK